jgi:hypothetical protein
MRALAAWQRASDSPLPAWGHDAVRDSPLSNPELGLYAGWHFVTDDPANARGRCYEIIEVGFDTTTAIWRVIMTRLILASCLILAAEANRTAQAQVTVDVSKITCDQYTGYKITNPQNIAIWLSGYYNGKRNNTMLDTQGFAAQAKKLQDYCIVNPNILVMQAVDTLMAGGK